MAAAARGPGGPHGGHGGAHGGPPSLGPFNADRKHSEPERWICIYPAYFNGNKSRAEGRVMPKSKCVPNPTYLEIRDVLLQNGWNPIVENKQYPRERSRELEFRGRIRVQLRNDDGSPFKDEFTTRESVLEYLGKMIPTLKSRTSKQNQGQESQSSSQHSKKGKKKK